MQWFNNLQSIALNTIKGLFGGGTIQKGPQFSPSSRLGGLKLKQLTHISIFF